jgi:transmembrane sensor
MNARTEQDRIDSEAAEWVVALEDQERASTPKEQLRWFKWLRRSPRHVQSYFEVADIHERLGRMDPDHELDIDEWLTDRKAPVIAIAPTSASLRLEVPSSPFKSRWWWATAASLTTLVVVVALSNYSFFGPLSYRTRVGQQSINRLTDGSVVNLNTDSRARVRYSDTERTVDLEGEALFVVAPDPKRPFTVRTTGAAVRALGTKFNVHEQNGETQVTVIEGLVQVSSDANLQPPVKLSAGEAARVARGRVAKVRAPDVEAQVAWQDQKLIFEDATLAEVAAEFNRYNEARFLIEGPVGRTKRLSGTFDALHPQSLLLYLQKDSSVTVQTAGDDFVVRGR